VIRKISLNLLLIVLLSSLSTTYRSAGQAPDPISQSEQNWTLLDGPAAPGGIVDDLVETPQSLGTLYALFRDRSGERLFRSLDASLTWQQVYTFTAQVNHLSVAPAISTTLFAGGQEGTFRSINGGLSWVQVNVLGEALAVAPDAAVFTTGKISAGDSCNTYAVARSSNNGDDWQTSLLDCIGGITQLEIDPTNSETIYAAGYITETEPRFGTPISVTRLWRSQDGGQTFTTLLNDGISHYGKPTSLVIDPQSPQRLYLSSSGVMSSNDYGENWQTISDIPPNSYKLMKNGDSLYAMQTNTFNNHASVYRSQDEGHTWWKATRELPSQVNAIAANPAQPDRVYVGMGGFGIFLSDTQGGDWQERNVGIQSPAGISCLAVAQSDPNTIYAGSYEPRGGLFGSYDGGLTWQYILTDTKVLSVAVSPSDAGLVFAGDMDGLLRSENGQGWTRIYSGDPVYSISLPITGSVGLYIAGNRSYGLGAYAARFLGLVYGAWGWSYSSPIGDAFQIQKVLLDPDHPGRVYVGAMTNSHGGAIYKRENGQDIWQTVLENADAEVIDLLIDPRHPGTIYASTYDGVYVSQDEGTTWVTRNSGFPVGSAANRLALDELGTLYTATYYTGVYRWDSGQAWWIQDGLAGQPVKALAFWPGSPPALLAGNETGLWKRELPTIQNTWMPVIISQGG
jgi:photosystem II stability/assembly factor-like uncharacterized protein